MMKNEWDPLQVSKPPDVKKRLESLFGKFDQYSESLLKTGYRPPILTTEQTLTSPSTIVPIPPPILKNDIINGDELIESTSSSTQPELKSIIGELVNVSYPISPVPTFQSISKESNEPATTYQLTNGNEKVSSNIIDGSTEKNLARIDFKTVLKEILYVSPLLSPLNITNIDEVVDTVTNKRKRPNPNAPESRSSGNTHKRLVNTEMLEMNTATTSSTPLLLSGAYKINLSNGVLRKLLNDYKILNRSHTQTADKFDCLQHSTIPERNTPKPIIVSSISSTGRPVVRIMVEKELDPNCYPTKAREVKRKGDEEKDHIMRVLLYLESLAFYIMNSTTFASKPDKMYSLISDAVHFLNTSWSAFKSSKSVNSSSVANTIKIRLKTLQMMISSCLAYNLYAIRSTQAFSVYSVLTQFEKENPPPKADRWPGSRNNYGPSDYGNGAAVTTSPAASTPNSNRSRNSQQPSVSIPVDIYSSMSQQIRTLHQLMWSHKLWKDAKASIKTENKAFIEGLNADCGKLRKDSVLIDLADYLLTAVARLREEYAALVSTRQMNGREHPM